MFLPFARFDEAALEGFLKEGQRYFVRQDFPRARSAFDEGIRGYFLLCHYADYFRAKEHFDTLVQDPFRFLYDWEEEEHRKKLLVAASSPKGYRIYTNTFLPDWERHLTTRIHQKIRAYVKSLGWKPRSGEGVEPVFYPHFGEVYIRLKMGKREVRVKFEEIEKIL